MALPQLGHLSLHRSLLLQIRGPESGSPAVRIVCPPLCKALKSHRNSPDALSLVTTETDPSPDRGSVQFIGTLQDWLPSCSVVPGGALCGCWLRQPRADCKSRGQGVLAPTFHTEGLQLGQVPNGTWEIRQLIPFHVQYLREREK